MKDFFIKYKSQIIKITIMLMALILISVISMLMMMAFGLIYFDDGVQLNLELFDSFKDSWYGGILIIIIQVIVTTLLCFIPGSSMTFIILIQSIYDNPFHAFLYAFIGVMLSSFMMYAVGRLGGYKICEKILGEEDTKKSFELLNKKCDVYFPLMMMFPAFPDDALIMIAGTLKMKLNWFIPSVVIGRGIGIATIVFGLAIIPTEKFTTPWHWIAFILLCLIFVIIIFKLANKFNKFLEKKRNEPNNN